MTHQRLPLDVLFRSITKGSVSIGADDTNARINWCCDLALGPRPGPVHVALASDVANEECRPCLEAVIDIAQDGVSIQPLLERLAGSSRPLLLAGLGAAPEAAPAIRLLLDRLQCPILVTPKVKGIVSEDDPRFAGVASGMALDGEVVETLREADLIVAIGFDPVECDKTWFADLNVVAIDDVSMAEGDYRPREILGDIPVLVAALTEQIEASKPWPADLLEARRRVLRPELPPPAGNSVSPVRLIEGLRRVFPRDGIATCDVGSHKLCMGQFWKAYEPGTFLMSNGLSGMGFGIPAAIAAQLARPDQRVVAVVGDGGMLMMIHDLTLIRELQLPILIVVFRDASLSLIRLSGNRRGYPAYGVDFTPPDFPGVARAFGIAAGQAGDLQDACAMAEKALESRAPFLLEVPVDWREYQEVIR